MKKISILSLFLFVAVYTYSQDFKKETAAAKASYKAGKLEDAHFALQQTMQSLDITIGKEVLKLFPEKLGDLPVNAKDDNVAGNASFVGATIHRTYGTDVKKADVEIVDNSPLVGTVNAFLTSPLLAGLGSNGKSKVLKIQGYKARLTKEDETDPGKPSCKIEMPMSNALITLQVNNTTDSEILAMANTIPFDKIAKLIQ